MKDEDLYTYVKKCMDCGGKTVVVDSRTQENGTILRRRVCSKCGTRFNTIEIEESMLEVGDLIDELDDLRKRNQYLISILKNIRGQANAGVNGVGFDGGNKK